jgi:hypothetical protein
MASTDSGKDSLFSRQMARRLIDSRQPEPKESDGHATAVAAACDALYRELSRWVGRDGCHALFTRALAQARTESKPLEQIELRPGGADAYVEGVAESILSHGDFEVAEALESVLVNLIELLGRLVGENMAAKLIERGIAPPGRRDATSNDGPEAS